MFNFIRKNFPLVFIITFVSCFSEDEENLYLNDPNLSYFECIWENNSHVAFTDLIQYKGKYYCCFRDGTTHIPRNMKEYGGIRVLESMDGNQWKSILYHTDNEFDLRDPKFSITPDNRLMLLYANSSLNESGTLEFRESKVIFLSSTANNKLFFNKTYNVSIPDKWLWKVVWDNDVAYGVAYSHGGPILVRSRDGINYELLQSFDNLSEANEADLYLMMEDNG